MAALSKPKLLDNLDSYFKTTVPCYFFMLACSVGFFGQDCVEKCNDTCKGCNSFDGLCDKGCISGWKGRYCEQRKSVFSVAISFYFFPMSQIRGNLTMKKICNYRLFYCKYKICLEI